jgi:VCBS repeat-containing protein
MKTDNEIQKDVVSQIKWEPILNSAAIEVAVQHGVVTLTGHLDTYAEKRAAEQVAKKVVGVKAVVENLQVGVPPIHKRSDNEIAEVIVNNFKWNTLIPVNNITVTVEHGVVTLDGEVEWNYQRRAAVNAVESLSGVRAIVDRLTVKPTLMAKDIKEKIKDAFQRTAVIEANKIFVDVQDHKVILKGHVRSFAEMEEAKSAAWSAPGVTAVEDKLQLELEPEEEFTI